VCVCVCGVLLRLLLRSLHFLNFLPPFPPFIFFVCLLRDIYLLFNVSAGPGLFRSGILSFVLILLSFRSPPFPFPLRRFRPLAASRSLFWALACRKTVSPTLESPRPCVCMPVLVLYVERVGKNTGLRHISGT